MGNTQVITVKGRPNFNPALVFWCMDKPCGTMVATFLVKAFYARQIEYKNVSKVNFITIILNYHTARYTTKDVVYPSKDGLPCYVYTPVCP